MNRIIIACLLLAGMASQQVVRADEGMWLPLLLKRLNYEDMKKKGCKLTADEIYNINNSSLKDAIVMLSGGSCTAEAISSEGLLLTNHHCGYEAIQTNSTVEHDYLTNGFYAKSKSEELPSGGITASFAMLGDINIAEPKALIGFAGRRVVKETIGKDLPEGFQSAEFVLEHGFLDYIVERKNVKNKLSQSMHWFMLSNS